MSSRHDFDFLHGNWWVENRKLKRRLEQCNDWQQFSATLCVRPILNGLGNVDEFAVKDSDFKGTTLRLFNPETRQWSLYWVDSLNVVLQLPLVGSFKDDVGTFYSIEEWQGTPVLVRFLWTGIDEHNAQWEQAFSADDGASWETNWTMVFERISD